MKSLDINLLAEGSAALVISVASPFKIHLRPALKSALDPSNPCSSPKKIFKKQPTLFYKKCSVEIGKVFEP